MKTDQSWKIQHWRLSHILHFCLLSPAEHTAKHNAKAVFILWMKDQTNFILLNVPASPDWVSHRTKSMLKFNNGALDVRFLTFLVSAKGWAPYHRYSMVLKFYSCYLMESSQNPRRQILLFVLMAEQRNWGCYWPHRTSLFICRWTQ